MLLTDRMMLDEDGLGLVGRVQNDPSLAQMPIIILSSSGNALPRTGWQQSGNCQNLTKPVRQSDLYNAMVQGLQQPKENPQPVSSHHSGQQALQLVGRVLLAEDNLVNQEVALAMLDNLGLSYETVTNGADALDILQRQHFDLILMDCQMPTMDGFQATMAIRQSEQGTNQHIPIMALTANAVSGDRERCLACGMDDYLSKPFTQEQLTTMLAEWLPSAEAPQVDVTEEAETATAQETIYHELDPRAIENLRALRAGLLLKVLDIWLEESPRLLSQIQQSVAEPDFPVLLRAAHSLKNSAANLGARRLAQLCLQMEQKARQENPHELPNLLAEIESLFMITKDEIARLRQEETA